MAKTYSVQPRFKLGEAAGGWALVDSMLQLGARSNVPVYGSEVRDLYLSLMWMDEPMTAGAFATWIAKAQTVDWKVVGGRNNAKYYATLFANAEGGQGWSRFIGMLALDHLCCDKGALLELGRSSPRSTVGRVRDIQQMDASRSVKRPNPLPGKYWRYYPEQGKPVDIPDPNLIQLVSVPMGRDRFRRMGYCAMSRLLDAKQLMLGYLTYFRQEIGDLPPELIAIINGLPQSEVIASLDKYKADKEKAGHTQYGKVWWLGSNNPSSPVSLTIHNMTVPNKSFNYQTMTEWYIKTVALNLEEDVGEFWLLQTGESKTVQSIQAQKSRGKGTARFLFEFERMANLRILPFGARFVFDNTDDEQDKARADILAVQITNLKNLAAAGMERQELVFQMDEIRQIIAEWGVLPPDMIEESVPQAIGSMLKEVGEGAYVCDNRLKMHRREPLLKGQEARDAMAMFYAFRQAYDMMSYDGNGYGLSEVEFQPMIDVAL